MGAAAWIAVGAVTAVVIGRVIRQRDAQVPELPRPRTPAPEETGRRVDGGPAVPSRDRGR